MNLKKLKTLGHLGVLAAILSVTTTTAGATTWYLLRNQVNSENFNSFALWNSNSTGTGTAATAMDPTATYDTNGKAVRSSNVALSTFSGGPLVLNHSDFTLKAVTTQVANLTTSATDADILNGNPASALKLRVTDTFAVNGNTGIFSNATDRSIALEVGTLTGTGNLLIGGARQITVGSTVFSAVTLNVTDALNYTGNIIIGAVTSTNLSFTSNFSSGGALKLTTGGTLNLSNNLSFAGGIFLDNNFITLSDGTYDYATLIAANASLAGVITDQGGNIIIGAIPEPSAIATLSGFLVLIFSLMFRRRRAETIVG